MDSQKIAIIGAGFSGLAVAAHLLYWIPCEVTLFDHAGLGGGASGLAAGLLHPYVGEKAKRNLRADEALASSEELLALAEKEGKPVRDKSPIVRIALSDEQKHNLESYEDVTFLGDNRYLIQSGQTVYSMNYLEGLFSFCEKRGAKLVKREIKSLDELESFDTFVVTAGVNSMKFDPELKKQFSALKGQVLLSRLPKGKRLERSLVGKGYIAKTEDEKRACLGSTYERDFSDGNIDRERAERDIGENLKRFYPEALEWEVEEVKAGFRLCRKGHYLPVAYPLDKGWVLTGMGSRGLLYHALYAKELVEMVISSLQ